MLRLLHCCGRPWCCNTTADIIHDRGSMSNEVAFISKQLPENILVNVT